MCGLAGYIDLEGCGRINREILERMTEALAHRGPDSRGHHVDRDAALGFRRLSIIDLAGGDQPMYNEDRSLVLVCNGEIFNHHELRRLLEGKGHRFSTACDVEVLLHLYEEFGTAFFDRLNGQFAFALYDIPRRRLLLARDEVGIAPLYYTCGDGVFIFASEIKAILQHPSVRAEVDLVGLDQVLTFPGLVSPRTMFRGIQSLKPGHFVLVDDGHVGLSEYWDLDYPLKGELPYDRDEGYYVETLGGLLEEAVQARLQSDVPVGFYLSGGLDSSLIAALLRRVSPEERRHAFSIDFRQPDLSEARYQQMVAEMFNLRHHRIVFEPSEIASRLPAMVRHSECPVHETYNTCSLALSQAARCSGVPVVLAGEGADELFAGYVGYRFDRSGMRWGGANAADAALEEEMRERLWGDPELFYERDYAAHSEIRRALYSDAANARLEELDVYEHELVNTERLRGRDPIHQRSYLDFKLRLADHLLTDHGDRMAMANAVETRYPFLDKHVIEFARRIPPALKLRGLTEKYVLKRVARPLLPEQIVDRQKFGFVAPGSPYLLRQNLEWIDDMLSHDRIARQGYFNPDMVERLKERYTRDGFRIHVPFESDLLMIVLTFGLLLEQFNLPDLN